MSVRIYLMLMLLYSGFVSAALNHHDNQQRFQRIAVIDRFYPAFLSEQRREDQSIMYGMLDIDADDQRDALFHGDLVQMVAADPRVIFLRYPIRAGKPALQQIQQQLQQILLELPRRPVDGLILSWESSTLISALDRQLRPRFAERYQAVVRHWGKSSDVWRQTAEIIEQLEQLSARGVQVYTIAGNGGRAMVNTFSFARGVITVGAVEPELAHYVADNGFVDTYARAAYELVRIDDRNGRPLGYDIDGDWCADIPMQRLSSYGQSNVAEYPNRYWKLLKGSSFAAPAALKKAMLPPRGEALCP